MNAYQLLELFGRHAVVLETDGDKLRCKAPKGFLDDEMLQALKQHKAELIALLSDTDPTAITRRAADQSACPLSFSQRQLWFLDQMEPGNAFYNVPSAVTLRGSLDVGALEKALNGLIVRHEILRTTFCSVDGEPRQVIHPAITLLLPVTDLRHLTPAEREEHVGNAVERDARTPFDLASGPLLRASLLRLADDEYLWLYSVHHIIADGWSMGVIAQEIATLYADFLLRQPSSLAPLAVQYADYACWQQQRLSDAALETQLDFWRHTLADAPACLNMPVDRPRPAVQRYVGATFSSSLDGATLRALGALGRQTQGTLFNVLMGTLAVLLWRHSGQQDLCIGTPFANRSRPEIEPLIGHFVNTQVIRQRLDPQQTFAQLLRELRATLLAVHAHQDVPFDRVVEALNPPRDSAYSPLFQVMMVLQNTPGATLQMPGLSMTPYGTGSATAKFDLAFEWVERDGLLHLLVEYNTDLFDRSTIERLSGHYRHLLEQVAADAKQPIGALALMADAEREQMLHQWNCPAPLAQPIECVHRLIEARVARRPDDCAVVFEGQSLSYRELNCQANRLAHHLRQLGVGPDVRVAVCIERSLELPVALLAVLKAGGAYVPLDPDYPQGRLSHILDDACPAAVLTLGATRAILRQALQGANREVPIVDLQADAVLWADCPTDNPQPAHVGVTDEHLAYVLYTSGTTGLPKGAMVTHRGLSNLLLWCQQFCGESGTMLHKIPFGFDASAWETFWPLVTGGRLIIARPGGHFEPGYLAQVVREQQVTAMVFVPAMLQLFLEADEVRDCRGLKDVFSGGGELSPALARLFQERLPHARLHNVYGPTETTVISSIWTLEPGAEVPQRQLPIGRPIANTRFYVLDQHDSPVPVGVSGQLHIGGFGVARGYLGLAELSAERFIDNPFIVGDRLYRSGDLARYRADGQLEFLGRNDFQVKLRGMRLELSEIEARLDLFQGVRASVVLMVGDSAQTQRLVACCVVDQAPDESAVRAHLATTLSTAVLPSAYLWLDAMPLTVNGKIDRQALTALADQDLVARQVNLGSPRDHIELALYQIWKDLLLVPQIGIRDNFFNVGGTSIAAIKMAYQIGQTFAVKMPVRVIIAHPTIEALGGWLRTGASLAAAQSNLIEFRRGAGQRNVVCIHPAGGTAFCYLSLAKELPEHIGVYGVQSPGLNPGESTEPTVEAMAEAYLQRIAALITQPLILTGLSFGGLVAYEMARRLTAAGHRQVTVVLLDTQGSEEAGFREQIGTVDMAEFRDKLVRFNGMYPGIEDAQVERYFHLYNHNRLAMAAYECEPQAGRIVLIQAREGFSRQQLHELRRFWRLRASDGYRARLVHGGHWDMLESAEVHRVSQTLRQELQRFDSQEAR
ncbi:Non-ribosomal peptide synthetase [Pseudomonas tremae]|uniref:Non-ribosomal peptide synthetase n=2 Tax=Pseudomonas tremae TaxID=200454 RepID=A0AA40P771_9PSED|nr:MULTISPECIES: non-ribosomal peptide synthetase [Pseudomonas syringae group]KPZ05811.1 Non-ribosomal peptide synthetase [Pseudomonas tremae]MCQ3016819.1 non-ribosomal peptide synthetase [Pseudomonas tremae]QGL57689.1 non-ribosomal peptide synthetase [Pseudomonas coronafaciens pv. oryzae str. 1_6]RMM32207.1 Non-ribosomal peptide synthetase [Pseudomonas coronafaciens pv. oryzae]RMN98298.1 Non-ribosomal peptide synthetase [Pseudomonas coronafaciens pv. coronafaciens]